jgi:thiamine pyrophosphate-dependent acetolactate synthase large subunit-like protein
LREVNERLRQRGHSNTGFRTPEFASYLDAERRRAAEDCSASMGSDGLLDPRAVVASLDSRLPADAWVVIGQGHYWAFPIANMRGPGGARFVVAGESGAVGNALGTAIGFAEGAGDAPVVLVEGDGSLMMHLQELDTVRRYGTRLLILLMNDEAFGSELHSLRAHGVDASESVIPSPDFGDVAGALGWVGVRADSLEQCEKAIEAFFSDTRPYVIDARISREVVSPPARRLEYGENVFCPLL